MKAFELFFVLLITTALCSQVTSPAHEFIRGLMYGVGESGDLTKFYQCFQGIDNIISDYYTAFVDLNKPVTVVTFGITEFVHASMTFIGRCCPCDESLTNLKHLERKMTNLPPRDAFLKMFNRIHLYRQDISDGLNSYKNNDMSGFGKNTALMLRRLYLEAL